MNRRQRTLAREAVFEGVGLHTGSLCRVTVKPAAEGTGIRFFRSDQGVEVPTAPEAVSGTARGTTLSGPNGACLHTVEHFLAAVAGLGLDNLVVQADAEEMPILDGSALPFVKGLKAAGVVEQSRDVEPLCLSRIVVIEEKGIHLKAEPCDRLVLDVTTSFPRPGLERQRVVFEWAEGAFERELAPARTFCMEEEIAPLKDAGLIQGATLDCGIVMGQNGPTHGPLKWPDELSRHKALDLLGDLTLLNRPLKARVTVEKAGHRTHVMLARAIREAAVKTQPGATMLDINGIMKILPHRYPFLMVDRILEVEAQKRAVGLKNVTMNEAYFQGHFPGAPLMPGVLQLEAMAQVGGVAFLYGQPPGSLVLFAAAENARWRKPVVPGDQMRVEVELVQVRQRLIMAHGRVLVDGAVVSEADITCMRSDAQASTQNGG